LWLFSFLVAMNLTHNFRSEAALARYSSNRKLWDTPLFESHSFVALPTVGAFIEGWLLVVPRAHALNYARISDDKWDEAENFLSEVSRLVEAEYGQVAVFEHGPAARHSAVGCGVDYAHFHIVPTAHDIYKYSALISSDIKWRSYPDIRSIKALRNANDGYWALLQKQYSANLRIGTTTSSPPNQLFRRALAMAHGLDNEKFDWKHDSGESVIAATIERLAWAANTHG
jgi:ATP adenylyltransferase